jgi:hypothetical protein
MTRDIGDFRNPMFMETVHLRALTTVTYVDVRRQISVLSSNSPLNRLRTPCSLRGSGIGTTSRASDLSLLSLSSFADLS